MLDTLVGSESAAKVLMFIANNGDAYAQEIADATGLCLSQVQRQLQRLERGCVLVSRPRGRMRFYSFNPRWPFSERVAEMGREAVSYLLKKDQEAFTARRRPRMKGKPLQRTVTA